MCVRAYVCDPALPERKRWITVEMDCKPVGKQSNYDVLGSKVRAAPLAIRHSSILGCITWPITYCVSKWFIAPVANLAWQTAGKEWVIVLYVLRLWYVFRLCSYPFDTCGTHTGAVTACNQLTDVQEVAHKHAEAHVTQDRNTHKQELLVSLLWIWDCKAETQLQGYRGSVFVYIYVTWE